jgi:NADH:ubiquinone oxidoreductase subunit E
VDASKCTGCGDCEENCPISYRPNFLEAPAAVEIEEERQGVVAKVLERRKREPGCLLPILIDINTELGWLPPDVLRHVSGELDVPLAQILRVATFYNFFSLEPRGKHTVSVCLGTGCFVKGGKTILSKLERQLGVAAGETTEDMNFSLEVVRCLGCCALAPVVRIDDDVFGEVNPDEAHKLLDAYKPPVSAVGLEMKA